MKSVLPAGSCFTDGTGEEVLESPGLMNSGLGKGQVHDRGRERGSKSGSISTKCGCWAASAMVEKELASNVKMSCNCEEPPKSQILL